MASSSAAFDEEVDQLRQTMRLSRQEQYQLEAKYTSLCKEIRAFALSNMRLKLGSETVGMFGLDPLISTDALEVIPASFDGEQVFFRGVLTLNNASTRAKQQCGGLYFRTGSEEQAFFIRSWIAELDAALRSVAYGMDRTSILQIKKASYDVPSGTTRFPRLNFVHQSFVLCLTPVFVTMCESYLSFAPSDNYSVSHFGHPDPERGAWPITKGPGDPTKGLFCLVAAPLLGWINLLPRASLYRMFIECSERRDPSAWNGRLKDFTEIRKLAKCFWAELQDCVGDESGFRPKFDQPLDYSRSGFDQLDDEQKQRFSERCTEVLENLENEAKTVAMIRSSWDAFVLVQSARTNDL